jgi:hypothetical protein
MTLRENAGLVLVSRAGCRVVRPCKHQWKRAELFPRYSLRGCEESILLKVNGRFGWTF